MKMVQGFLGGLPVFGVLAPALPSTGLLTSSPSSALSLLKSGVPATDASVSFEAAGSGVAAPSSAFSFLKSFFFFPLSADPLILAGLSASAVAGGGVEGVDLLTMCGGRALSGTGVDPFVGTTGGKGEVEELGVAAPVAVRR